MEYVKSMKRNVSIIEDIRMSLNTIDVKYVYLIFLHSMVQKDFLRKDFFTGKDKCLDTDIDIDAEIVDMKSNQIEN